MLALVSTKVLLANRALGIEARKTGEFTQKLSEAIAWSKIIAVKCPFDKKSGPPRKPKPARQLNYSAQHNR